MKFLKHRETEELKFIESTVNVDLYVWEREVIPEEGDSYMEYSEYELIDSNEFTPEQMEDLLNEFIRPRRDQLLKESDQIWLERSSKGQDVSNVNAWKQALRDLPEELDIEGIDYIDEIEFPEYSES